MSDDYYHDDPIEEKTKRKLRTNLLTPAALIIGSVLFFQSTFAGNITLNSGASVEFGQGVSQAVACSGSNNLTLTPYSTFTNAAGAGGTHYFSSFTVSGIPASCDGVDFSMNAFGNSSIQPLAILDKSFGGVMVYNSGSTFTSSYGTSISGSAGTFTVNFTDPIALSSSVFKLTIQSSPRTTWRCAQGGSCSVGDIGPASGKIFYATATPFSCGPTRSTTCRYLEAAPNSWSSPSDPTRTWAQSTPIKYDTATVKNASSPETATATAIGWGHRNTLAIILQGNTNPATSAAALAASYMPTIGGVVVDDWFLPAYAEVAALLTNAQVVGLTSNKTYWSSSESSATAALNYAVNSSWIVAPGNNSKNNGAPTVRAVRSF
ncbi:hypothetical protein [Candidatus Planktophila versatilis]|uniref:hypothetical protein n=1 Tax=Candidatus Planktophila versatilis TaxID=1884905 RepID=UPI003CEED535